MGDVDFPQYVAFKGDNGKYLGFHLGCENRGFMKFGYDDMSSPYVRHQVVSDPDNKSYVHIKCCYNNKFWRREAIDRWWILAAANSFNTDQSSWSCTLFAPRFVGSNKVSLKHLQLNKFGARWRLGAQHKLDSCLFAGEEEPDQCGVLTYYDLGLPVTLPKYVAFKGDNGKYLGFYFDGENRGFNMKFGYDDLSSPYVKHEVVSDPANESYVHMKCCYNNKFWSRLSRDRRWIFAGADSFNTDQSSWSCTLFDPRFVDMDKVSLRHLQLDKFAACLPHGAQKNLVSYLYVDEENPECGVMTYYDLGLPGTLAFKGYKHKS